MPLTDTNMGARMRTTIEISDALFADAKRQAARRGVTMRTLVEQGLRQVLAEGRGKTKVFALRRATFKGRGLQAGVDGASWERVWAMAYEGRGA
jgi:Arc/MetJ family transcription regulator